MSPGHCYFQFPLVTTFPFEIITRPHTELRCKQANKTAVVSTRTFVRTALNKLKWCFKFFLPVNRVTVFTLQKRRKQAENREHMSMTLKQNWPLEALSWFWHTDFMSWVTNAKISGDDWKFFPKLVTYFSVLWGFVTEGNEEKNSIDCFAFEIIVTKIDFNGL